MQNRMKNWSCFLLVATVLVSGCSSPGSEFVGKWVNPANNSDTMEIVPNGKEYLILEAGNKIGATYDHGSLEVAGMMGSVRLTYVKSSDTLVAPGFFGQNEYKRAK